jgi:hypothetical protein
VAGRQPERIAGWGEFEGENDGEEGLRTPSPRNPDPEPSRVGIQRRQRGEEVSLRCRREGRQAKDRALRETPEQRLKKDRPRLPARLPKSPWTDAKKIYPVIGRLPERYPRLARYCRMDYDAEAKALTGQEDGEKKVIAEPLDGGYVRSRPTGRT